MNSDLSDMFDYISQKDKNLADMEKFFKCDLEIKKEMLKMAPDELDRYNEEYIICYSDKVFQGMKNIEFEMKQLLSTFNLDKLSDTITSKIQQTNQELMNCGYDFDKMKDIYQKNISEMTPEIIKETKENLVGYKFGSDRALEQLTQNSRTINDVLHVMHSYVTNNEKILGLMPIIAQKKGERDSYTLYGIEDEMARQIYDNIVPSETSLGITQILSLKDKILMMVRDSGHALTLQINKGKNNSYVSYFIPKICNIQMVNKLKGIIKVDELGNNTATGGFLLDGKNQGKEIIDFINKVPTDLDIGYTKESEVNRKFEKKENDEKSIEEPVQINTLPQKENAVTKAFYNIRKKLIDLFGKRQKYEQIDEISQLDYIKEKEEKIENSWELTPEELKNANDRIIENTNAIERQEKHNEKPDYDRYKE